MTLNKAIKHTLRAGISMTSGCNNKNYEQAYMCFLFH